MKNCSKNEVISIGKAVCEHFNLKEKIGDKNALKSIFNNFREMDGNIQAKDFAKGSALANKKMLTEAFSYYPKAWQTICGILVDKYILKKCEEDSFVPGRLSLVASIMNLTLMIFVISMFLFICLEIGEPRRIMKLGIW